MIANLAEEIADSTALIATRPMTHGGAELESSATNLANRLSHAMAIKVSRLSSIEAKDAATLLDAIRSSGYTDSGKAELINTIDSKLADPGTDKPGSSSGFGQNIMEPQTVFNPERLGQDRQQYAAYHEQNPSCGGPT